MNLRDHRSSATCWLAAAQMLGACAAREPATATAPTATAEAGAAESAPRHTAPRPARAARESEPGPLAAPRECDDQDSASWPESAALREQLADFRGARADPDWSRRAERTLRDRLAEHSSKLHVLECRQPGCVVGITDGAELRAALAGITWAGASSELSVLTRGGCTEAVVVFWRHAMDRRALGSRRVDSTQPLSCPGAVPRSSAATCRFLVGPLCFETLDRACECACSRIAQGKPACALPVAPAGALACAVSELSFQHWPARL